MGFDSYLELKRSSVLGTVEAGFGTPVAGSTMWLEDVNIKGEVEVYGAQLTIKNSRIDDYLLAQSLISYSDPVSIVTVDNVTVCGEVKSQGGQITITEGSAEQYYNLVEGDTVSGGFISVDGKIIPDNQPTDAGRSSKCTHEPRSPPAE